MLFNINSAWAPHKAGIKLLIHITEIVVVSFLGDRENTNRKSKEACKTFHTNLLTPCCRAAVHYEQWSLCFSLQAKLGCHFHLCNVHRKGLCATFHRVILLLSNAEREKNENMNQWSNFPSHIPPQAEMMSHFTSKISLNGKHIWEEEIQRKPIVCQKVVLMIQQPACLLQSAWWTKIFVWCMAVTAGVLWLSLNRVKKYIWAILTPTPNKSWRVCKTGSLYSQGIQPPTDT